ncbi:MAG: hypothetical protein AAFP69_03150 [Planctomycetota bacterium]
MRPKFLQSAVMANDEKVTIENVNNPGITERVDAAKYHAMRDALLQVLPTEAPGMTHKEFTIETIQHLPQDLFPAGKTAMWWSKTVQLDLEAKGVIARSDSKPLTWYRCG